MDPNTQPSPPSVPAGLNTRPEPVVDFIRNDRQMAAYILLGLSIVFLAATVWLAAKSFRAPRSEEPDKTAEKSLDPLNPELPKPEVTDPGRNDYTVGWIACMAAFVALAGQGAWLLAALPAPTLAEQRTEARKVILRVGTALGALLILTGVVLFYRWSSSLTAWLDKHEEQEARWVVIPLMMVIIGAGLIFAAIQPARAEERNNAALRRQVYGSNLALTVLLLFVALVVANVVFAIRVPNRLDTTATGFYTLSDPTRDFLAQLDQPVTAYAILPDSGDRLTDDIRRLLQSCQDAGGGKFRVKFVNPNLNKTDLATLRARYTQLELNDTGVLLTVGEDEKATPRYTFIRADEFLDREASMMGRQSQPVFAGEAKLLRELMFLAEAKQKPVVYFTQSNGELDINGAGGADRSARELKSFLEKNYLDVRPHKFDPNEPKVPDDADVLIVAGPQSTIPPPTAEAIKKYMTEPRGGKKGKLIVLAGCPDPTRTKKVPPTGLEPVLAEFNITLGDKFIFTRLQGQYVLDAAPAAFSEEAARAKNPIAMSLRRYQITAIWPREVTVLTPGNPAYRATPLLMTDTDFAWLEEEFPENFNVVIKNLRQDAVRKRLTEHKTIGVVSGEPGQRNEFLGRVAVYGSSDIASDSWASRTRGTVPVEFDLIGVTIDWLRERQPVPTGVTSKAYTAYTFPPKVDNTRLLWLPLGLAFLTVLGFGAGVWVIRRK
jgi:hypothetical protein